jgi:DNA-binding response OmpR family regulator
VSAFASTSADDNRKGRRARSPPRPRVLIVEDEELIASMLADEIREFGCAVVGPARSLAEATAIASTAALDGALIDVELNGESVLPAAKILSDRNIPFVFTTGDTEPPEGTFHDVPRLIKPFTVKELRRTLQLLLRKGA